MAGSVVRICSSASSLDSTHSYPSALNASSTSCGVVFSRLTRMYLGMATVKGVSNTKWFNILSQFQILLKTWPIITSSKISRHLLNFVMALTLGALCFKFLYVARLTHSLSNCSPGINEFRVTSRVDKTRHEAESWEFKPDSSGIRYLQVALCQIWLPIFSRDIFKFVKVTAPSGSLGCH